MLAEFETELLSTHEVLCPQAERRASTTGVWAPGPACLGGDMRLQTAVVGERLSVLWLLAAGD